MKIGITVSRAHSRSKKLFPKDVAGRCKPLLIFINKGCIK
jgi:hypothetical protein